MVTSATVFPSDDVVDEILLRLPPQPSCLMRASLVCKDWRRLVADPYFLHRYRARHRGGAPILGVFHNNGCVDGRFLPTGDPPDRVPAKRFSPLDLGSDQWVVLDCHRDRVLLHDGTKRLLVWDPVTDDRCYVKLPHLNHGYYSITAVLLHDGNDEDDDQHARGSFPFRIAIAFVQAGFAVSVVYSSDTGTWADHVLVEAQTSILLEKSGVAVGDTVYWLLSDSRLLSLELDAGGRHVLAVLGLNVPKLYGHNVQLLRTTDGKLGFAGVMGFVLHLWALETDGGGATLWMPRKTLLVDASSLPGSLPFSLLQPERHRRLFGEVKSLTSLFVPGPFESDSERKLYVRILGVGEDGDVVFLWTVEGVFMVQLKSEPAQIKQIYETDETDGQFYAVYPYTSFFSRRWTRWW